LRAWRLTEARAQNVPAFHIFSDATLHEIARSEARSLDELGQVKGVGAFKLQRYGAAVLAVLAQRI
jgi:ATP-dependent DNA helicase RecQ